MKKHQIRIVGGIYKRTPINVIESENLRPTPDRVRETLFNWLNHFWGSEFADKHVLDLFAGSGALGLEAASRGVAMVQSIDNSNKAIQQINAIIKKLQANNIQAHTKDALAYLKAQQQICFDLILLDPPFNQDLLPEILPLLDKVLYSGGLVYIETGAAHKLILPDNFQQLRHGKSGNVQYQLLRFAATQKNSNNGNNSQF